MAWNEPGKDQDPWGNRGNKPEGPPDLDELVRKMQDKFAGMFGGKKSGGGKNGGRRSGTPSLTLGIGVLLLIGFVIWVLSGIYKVDEAERGVILRFGKFSEVTGPGPHWHWPAPIETVSKVNVRRVYNINHKAQMLGKDQNLISIDLGVQYQIQDPKAYLFNVRDPDYTLREATESALREVVGSKGMDEILNPGGRESVAVEAARRIQAIMDLYKTGLLVTKANIESTQPPEEVQDAFQDAIKAQEDEVRFRNQAEAYARDIIPKAEGDAQRILQQAEAYKAQVVQDATGETSRFLQVLAQYKKAPKVTRERLYIDTMESVLAHTSKVLVKVKQGSNIMYLPLDQMLQQRGTANAAASASDEGDDGGAAASNRRSAPPIIRRNVGRDREGR